MKAPALLRRFVHAALLALGILANTGASAETACRPPPPPAAGWQASFVAGCRDHAGRYAGGSQVLHLVPHKGRLYAASGYWMDANSPPYGGQDPSTGWAQVLRLDGPGQPWAVDLELGPRHVRTELLASVTFTQDGAGQPLAAPETLLVASTYDAGGLGGVSLFLRDDTSGTWTRAAVVAGPTGQRGEDNSVRKALVHRDRVSGREHLFVSVGRLGLFRADYRPEQPARLAWQRAPEFVPERTRILGLAIADGTLFVSDGQRVLRRVDGEPPRYQPVADFSDEVDAATPRQTFSAIGGIRGLTAIAGPVPGRQSLLLAWHGGRLARGCVVRLDPTPEGRWQRHEEVCLADLAAQRLGMPVSFVIGAYNEFLALPSPDGRITYVTGMQAFLTGPTALALTARNQRNVHGGYYGGALLALRDPAGRWRLSEVAGPFRPGSRALVAPYTVARSPFGGADATGLYLGGYDPNFFRSTDTGWVYRTDLDTLLDPAPTP